MIKPDLYYGVPCLRITPPDVAPKGVTGLLVIETESGIMLDGDVELIRRVESLQRIQMSCCGN